MGYYIEQRESSFEIKKKNFPKVIKAIKAMNTQSGGGGSWSKATGHVPHFSWVETERVMRSNDIKEIFEEWRWGIETDKKTGDICTIYFNGEKSGDDEQLFHAIAPYVESGSYIEMSGEDGEIWRWSFSNGKMEEQNCEIDWDDSGEIVHNILKNKRILPTLLGIHPTLDKRIAEALKK